MSNNVDPLVSVIIPVHNRFEFANKTIQSVYEQTYRPIELLIIDDFSQEPYTPRVESSHNFHVKTMRHKSNYGPGASRESGRIAAHGGYISYLDSDDLWHPEKLKKQVAMLKAQPETGMCYCISTEFSQLPITGEEKIRRRSSINYDKFLPTLLDGRPWGTGACLWTRKASELIGPWFPGWAWEDYEYDFRAGCNDIRICYIPEVLCHYRVDYGGEQLSRADRKSQMLHRTKSIMEMHKDLIDSGKVRDTAIRERFLKTVYFQAMHLLYLEEKEIGLELLEIVRKSSAGKIRRLTNFCKIVSPLLSSSFLGDLLYKYRNDI